MTAWGLKGGISVGVEEMTGLEFLLKYEVGQSARHRRYLSLGMVSCSGDPMMLRKILDEIVRGSDPLFSVNGHIVVLMGETDKEGALRAVERYKGAVNGDMDVRYAISSFPDDGKTITDLIRIGHRRLETAKTHDEYGAVVAHD